jgi:putative ABC transport system permease protein
MDLVEGDPADVRRRLNEGEVVIGTVLAHRSGLKVGDTINADTPAGPQRLRIAGTAIEYTVGGLVVYMERGVARRLLDIQGADLLLIRAQPDRLAEVEGRLRAIGREHGLMLHSFAELSRMLDALMSGLVQSLWVLIVLGLVVAAFGIANTLTMNVLEQTREIALLRVVAMTRGNVRKLFFAQASILGVIGLVSGGVLGVNTAYVISLCSAPLLGYPISFSLHPGLIAACLAAAFAIVLVAAWLPANRAAKSNLLVALQYE